MLSRVLCLVAVVATVVAKDCPQVDPENHVVWAKSEKIPLIGCSKTVSGTCDKGYTGTPTAKCCRDGNKWKVESACDLITTTHTTTKHTTHTTTSPKQTTTSPQPTPTPSKKGEVITNVTWGNDKKHPCILFDFESLVVEDGIGGKFTVSKESSVQTVTGVCAQWDACTGAKAKGKMCVTSSLTATFTATPAADEDLAASNTSVTINVGFDVNASFTNKSLSSMVRNDGLDHEAYISNITVTVANSTYTTVVTLDSDVVYGKTLSSKLNTSYECSSDFSYSSKAAAHTPATKGTNATVQLSDVRVQAFAPEDSTGFSKDGDNLGCPATAKTDSAGLIIGAILTGLAGLGIVFFAYKKCRSKPSDGYHLLESVN